MTDHGQRQPDFPTPGDSTLERFGADTDDFYQPCNDEESALPSCQPSPANLREPSPPSQAPAKEPSLPPHQLDHANPASDSRRSSAASGTHTPTSGIDLPSLEQIFSTARSSLVAKREKSQSVMAPPSNLINTGDKEYEAAMAKLDAEIAVSSDPDEANEITPKASKTFKPPMLLGLSAKKQTAETAAKAIIPKEAPQKHQPPS
jgi:hypothetical protein